MTWYLGMAAGTLVFGPLIVLIAYAATRAASVAYFRTKLEYLRSVLKEGPRNGEKGP